MLVLVAYDVPDDDLRKTLADCLEGYGRRVQGSVFECHLDAPGYDAMTGDVRALLADGDATVRCYRLCASCEARTEELGEGPPFSEPAYFIA